MKNVRVWFTKDGSARFISHLDLNRCISRVIHRSRIPIWYTEGFNPHAFLTFALPLSLGVRGKRESMDMKLLEEISEEELISRLNACLPLDIRVFAVTEPQMKPGKIASALYTLTLEAEGCPAAQVVEKVEAVLSQEELLVDKKSKSGIREINLKEFLGTYTLTQEDGCAELRVTLPAGSTNNINPNLILAAVRRYAGIPLSADITRQELYSEDGAPFQ